MDLIHRIKSFLSKDFLVPSNLNTPCVLKFLDTTRTVTLVDHRPRGTASPDRSAIVGKKDWLFIFEGSNRYFAQYTLSTKRENLRKTEQWIEIIEKRKKAVEKTGASFFQLIIPNKLSVYSKASPLPILTSRTPILKHLLRQNVSGLGCPIQTFRRYTASGDIFRRNDSHLNFFGLFHLYRFVFEALSLRPDPSLFEMKMVRTIQPGDLGGKFEPIIREALFAPEHTAFLERLNERLVWKTDNSREILAMRKHRGIRIVTQCQKAKNPAKLLVFGNSFCDHPLSWGFSPFLAQSVKEYHFVWAPHLDMAYVNEIKPDIVIAQTCERFLPKLPKDIIS